LQHRLSSKERFMRQSLAAVLLALGLVAAATLWVAPGLAAKPAARTAQEAALASLNGQQYSRLVIRNALLINGRGTPTEGPVDIVIDKDTITDIIPTDGVSMNNYGRDWRRPVGDRVIDATGMT
jgi:hypothetical protein